MKNERRNRQRHYLYDTYNYITTKTWHTVVVLRSALPLRLQYSILIVTTFEVNPRPKYFARDSTIC